MRNKKLIKKAATALLAATMTLAMSVSAFADQTITFHFQNSQNWETVGAWIYEGVGWDMNVTDAYVKRVDYDGGVKQLWPGALCKDEGNGWVEVSATFSDSVAQNGAVMLFNNFVADLEVNATMNEEDIAAIKASGILTTATASKEQTNSITLSRRNVFSNGNVPQDIYFSYDGTTVMTSVTAPDSYVLEEETSTDENDAGEETTETDKNDSEEETTDTNKSDVGEETTETDKNDSKEETTDTDKSNAGEETTGTDKSGNKEEETSAGNSAEENTDKNEGSDAQENTGKAEAGNTDETTSTTDNNGNNVTKESQKNVAVVPAADNVTNTSRGSSTEDEYVENLSDNNTSISSSDFKSILSVNATKDVVINSNNGISFAFAKGTMSEVNGIEHYDFGTTLVSDYNVAKEVVPYIAADKFVAQVNFNYSGKLPAKASITIPVGKDYADKTLYYSQITDNGLEFIMSATVDKDGFIIVSQDHCSKYVFTTEKPLSSNNAETPSSNTNNTTTSQSTAPKTGDNADTYVWLMMIAVSAGAVAVIASKKMKNA